MSTVSEVKSAIEQLSSSQLAQLSRWFDEYLEKAWDAQMEADGKAGKFSHFKDEIARAKTSGELLDFPTFSERWSGSFALPIPDPDDARLAYLLNRFST